MPPFSPDSDNSLSLHDNDVILGPLHQTATQIKPSSRRCKSVSFGAMVTVYKVKSRFNYTPKEVEASWYNEDEEHTMTEDARSEVRLLECGLLVESKDVCTRGLEFYTAEVAKRRKLNRMEASDVVFTELDYQYEKHCFDDELIANCYFVHTERCAMTAQLLGKKDEIEAMKIYRENQ